jgi:hypothetical protein
MHSLINVRSSQPLIPDNKHNSETFSLRDKNILVISDDLVHQEKASYAWVSTKASGEIVKQYQVRISKTYLSPFSAKALAECSLMQEISRVIMAQNPS